MKIFGGLLFENVVAEDRFFDLQMKLNLQGFIQGIQLRVAHPCFTPGLTDEDLPLVLRRLPEALEVFVHLGAENTGVDLGEILDEKAVYRDRGEASGISWSELNRESMVWGRKVINLVNVDSAYGARGVIHPGYMSALAFHQRIRIANTIRRLCEPAIALENVPWIVDRNFGASGVFDAWKADRCFGAGGCPTDMAKCLAYLGSEWKCLIDWTHMMVSANQHAEDLGLEEMVQGYLDLPHALICHYSGAPPSVVDDHGHIRSEIPGAVLEGLRQMKGICLEIPYLGYEQAVAGIGGFTARL